MTHAEQRTKLVEMMSDAGHNATLSAPKGMWTWEGIMGAVLTKMYSHYTINAVEVTEEMDLAGYDRFCELKHGRELSSSAVNIIFKDMAATGDLTKPEKSK